MGYRAEIEKLQRIIGKQAIQIEMLNDPRLEGEGFSNNLSTLSRPHEKIVSFGETTQTQMLMIGSTQHP
jgi:hypothetical protein